MQATGSSGCKGCGGCSCNKAVETVKEYYTAPDGTEYEIGKGDYAEPGKVYLNEYGVFLAVEGGRYANDPCEACCAWWQRYYEKWSIHRECDSSFVCGNLPKCSDFDVIFKCIESNVTWLKADSQQGEDHVR